MLHSVVCYQSTNDRSDLPMVHHKETWVEQIKNTDSSETKVGRAQLKQDWTVSPLPYLCQNMEEDEKRTYCLKVVLSSIASNQSYNLTN